MFVCTLVIDDVKISIIQLSRKCVEAIKLIICRLGRKMILLLKTQLSSRGELLNKCRLIYVRGRGVTDNKKIRLVVPANSRELI